MPRKNLVRKERQSRPAECAVCGEVAIGYNYDAPSCASCKAFFRRAVVKNQPFHGCIRNGVCAQIEFTRICRPCRYDRCIKGGMNPLCVTGADHPPLPALSRTSSVDEASTSNPVHDDLRTPAGTAKKTSVECQTDAVVEEEEVEDPADPGPSSRSDDATELRLVQNPFQIEIKLEQIMQSLLITEAAHHKLRLSSYTPKLVPALCIDDFAFVPSKLGAKYEPMLSQAHEPSAVELMPVEVIINKRIVMDLTHFDYSLRKMWQFQDVVYAIEFIKALTVFQLLDDNSKRVLASSALISSNYTTAFYSYSKGADRTLYPDGSVMKWSAELQEQSPDSTRFHTGLIAAMREAQLDRREYTLLKMIMICNPILDGIRPHDAALLQQEKERCTKTLFSYVLARRGASEGAAFFAKILSIVDVATKLTSWQKSSHILVMAMGLYKNRTPFAETIFHSQ